MLLGNEYEIGNGIIGGKRDCFLKLTKYMKYTNEKKLREVYFSLLIHSINFVLSL
jgi:hypothetical protein